MDMPRPSKTTVGETPEALPRNFLRMGYDAPVHDIMLQLGAHPELWGQHGRRKTVPGSPHAQMEDVWVRYRDDAPFEASGDWSSFNDEHIPIWYPAWQHLTALHPTVFTLARQVEAEMIGGILITSIPAGMGIDEHADSGWHVDYYDKFYLSLQSEPGAVFGCRGEDGREELLTPKNGEIWRFDNRKPHWVHNDSLFDRITCIICLRTHKFQKHPTARSATPCTNTPPTSGGT